LDRSNISLKLQIGRSSVTSADDYIQMIMIRNSIQYLNLKTKTAFKKVKNIYLSKRYIQKRSIKV
ncbi:hypothetical protein, partial [Aliiglaciecola lipolytica]